MLSAFGVDHGEVSKAAWNPQQKQIAGRAKKQAQGLWGAGAVGAAGALIARKPKVAMGIAAGAPVAVTGNAIRNAKNINQAGQRNR